MVPSPAIRTLRNVVVVRHEVGVAAALVVAVGRGQGRAEGGGGRVVVAAPLVAAVVASGVA